MKSLYKTRKDEVRVKKKGGRFAKKEDEKKLIKILNEGYGYDYVSKVFRCSILVIKRARNKLIKEGVKVKNLDENGGIKPGDESRIRYTKLFRKKDNIKRAIFLINRGYKPGRIARILNCDRTSILAFRKRMVKNGIHLREFDRRPIKIENVPEYVNPNKLKYLPEEVNEGKGSYSEYLSNYKPKVEKIEKSNIEKAKRVIRKVREKRIKDGLDEKNYGYLEDGGYKIDWSNY